MNSYNFIFILILGIAAGFAVQYYLRREKRFRSVILLSLRLGAVLLAALLFFQPRLKFARLLPEHKRTAILIDASASMKLFDTDSAFNRIEHLIDSIEGRSLFKTGQMPVFAFGDSLRSLKDLKSVIHEDKSSRFPSSFSAQSIRNAANVLIISDGNWSNFDQFSSLLQNKNVRYIPLRMRRFEPFLSQNASIQPQRSTIGSKAKAGIRINGYRASKDTLKVSILSDSFKTDTTFVVDSGFFDDSLELAVPTNQVGLRLFKISSRFRRDSLPLVSYGTHEVTAKKTRVAFVDSKHSLDKRFLGMALRGHEQIDIVSVSALREGDVALFLNWNSKNSRLFESFPASINVVFVGEPPCSNAREINPKTVSIVSHPAYETEFNSLSKRLPPPSHLKTCFPKAEDDLILSARTKNGNKIPLFYETIFSNRRVLILSVKGIWKWDFWPAADAQTDAERFSSFFIKRMISFAQRNVNRSFFAYPEKTPVIQSDSIWWSLNIPAPLRMQSRKINVGIQIKDGTSTVAESTFTIATFGAASARITQRPLDSGAYPYEVSLEADTGTMKYKDTLVVVANNREMKIHGLNKSVLEQTASEMDESDYKELSYFVGGQNTGDITVIESVAMRRSWITLLILAALLCVEWLFRRLWRYD